jgi:hypothetical protein
MFKLKQAAPYISLNVFHAQNQEPLYVLLKTIEARRSLATEEPSTDTSCEARKCLAYARHGSKATTSCAVAPFELSESAFLTAHIAVLDSSVL